MQIARVAGRRLGFVTIVLSLIGAAVPAGAQVSRVVSINLCADQLLLALADPDQIASLSTFATDPGLSFMAEKAPALPHVAGPAETVVGLQPDLVLAGRFTRRASRQMLKRLGYRVVELGVVRTIDEAKQQIAEIADILGHPGRGEVLIAEIDAVVAEVRAAAAQRSERPTAAIYQRRGYVTGAATFSSSLMEAVGLTNLGGTLAGERGGFVTLEEMIARPPDYLVVARGDITAEDQGSALLAHPALARQFPPARRLVLPERLTVCAGPAVAPALRRLADELARASRPR